MGWGTRIALLYGSFVVGIVTLVVLSMNQHFDLVSEDYYNQELKYQDKLDAMNRTNALKQQPKWSVNRDTFKMEFPSLFQGKSCAGKVHFFSPSDAQSDVVEDLHLDNNGTQSILLSKLKAGFYHVKVEWIADNQTYYKEAPLQYQP